MANDIRTNFTVLYAPHINKIAPKCIDLDEVNHVYQVNHSVALNLITMLFQINTLSNVHEHIFVRYRGRTATYFGRVNISVMHR